MIYATDINPESLRIAPEGVYDIDRFVRFSENYRQAGGRSSLSDYYTAEYSLAVLRESLCRKGFLGLGLRETLRFTSHADAFSEERIYPRR